MKGARAPFVWIGGMVHAFCRHGSSLMISAWMANSGVTLVSSEAPRMSTSYVEASTDLHSLYLRSGGGPDADL